LLIPTNRFTGPKITLDIHDLTLEQEQALAEEGLEVNLTGQDPDSPPGDLNLAEKSFEKSEGIA